MYSEYVNKMVRNEVEPILGGMGFRLVECSVARLKGAPRVILVIYRAEGVGIDECAEVSRLVFPRLQTMEGLADAGLEVSSPGIDRTFKNVAEYSIFAGRGVRILASGETEWIGGVIEKAEKGMLELKTGGIVKSYPLDSIRRARLDHSFDKKEALKSVSENKEDKNAV
jgi:ribosome maturation factor RimP